LIAGIETQKLQNTIYFLFIAIGVLAIDQLTKEAIIEHFALHQSIEIIPGIFHITYIRNTGAAFGILSGGETWRIYFFLVVGAVALISLFRFFYSNYKDPVVVTGTAMVCGGAAGNILDRIRYGYVIDFLDFFWGHYHWPAFNAADTAITIGVFLLLLHFIKASPEN